MELIIKYRNGSMCINIDKFLDVENITKFKKLLKIIRTSYTPEVEEVLKACITDFLNTVDDTLKVYANRIVNARTAWKEGQEPLNNLIARRDCYKRSTEPYKLYAKQIKAKRDELRALKINWCSSEEYFNNLMKRRGFCEKCLQIMSQ